MRWTAATRPTGVPRRPSASRVLDRLCRTPDARPCRSPRLYPGHPVRMTFHASRIAAHGSAENALAEILSNVDSHPLPCPTYPQKNPPHGISIPSSSTARTVMHFVSADCHTSRVPTVRATWTQRAELFQIPAPFHLSPAPARPRPFTSQHPRFRCPHLSTVSTTTQERKPGKQGERRCEHPERLSPHARATQSSVPVTGRPRPSSAARTAAPRHPSRTRCDRRA